MFCSKERVNTVIFIYLGMASLSVVFQGDNGGKRYGGILTKIGYVRRRRRTVNLYWCHRARMQLSRIGGGRGQR